MTQQLKNKIALVTGGSRGIGAAIVKRLAAGGATVAFTYVSAKDKAEALVNEVKAAGGTAIAIHADSADKKSVSAAVAQVIKSHGRLDILVNNAGVFVTGGVGDAANDDAALDRQFAVNVGGVIAAIEASAKSMTNGGRIVTIGSIVGDHTPFAGLAQYSASKAAVAAYTRGAARDFGARGITINTVQPGPINTDMNPENGEMAGAMKAGIPLGRYGTVDEVAAAVAFLVSPEASYITGTTLNVDGGISA